jgi:hypothetical protein
MKNDGAAKGFASSVLCERNRQAARPGLADELTPEVRKAIGEDIATLEFCWPIGMPRCSPIVGIKGLCEVRSNMTSGRIARVFFVLVGNQIEPPRVCRRP